MNYWLDKRKEEEKKYEKNTNKYYINKIAKIHWSHVLKKNKKKSI